MYRDDLIHCIVRWNSEIKVATLLWRAKVGMPPKQCPNLRKPQLYHNTTQQNIKYVLFEIYENNFAHDHPPPTQIKCQVDYWDQQEP